MDNNKESPAAQELRKDLNNNYALLSTKEEKAEFCEALLDRLVLPDPYVRLLVLSYLQRELVLDEKTIQETRKILSLLSILLLVDEQSVRHKTLEIIKETLLREPKNLPVVYSDLLAMFELGCEQTSLLGLSFIEKLIPDFPSFLVIQNGEKEECVSVDHLFTALCGISSSPFPEVRVKCFILLGKLRPTKIQTVEQAFFKYPLTSDNTCSEDRESVNNRNSYKTFKGKKDKEEKRVKEKKKEVKTWNITYQALKDLTWNTAIIRCGAFSHGIEDECKTVREAALGAIGEHAREKSQICVHALKFMIDTLNDTALTLRIEAVKNLSTLSNRFFVTLGDDHLTEIIFALEDKTAPVREGVRCLLQKVFFYNEECLRQVVGALLQQGTKYTAELEDIFRTLQRVGRNNPRLSAVSKEELLKESVRYGRRLGSVSFLGRLLFYGEQSEDSNWHQDFSQSSLRYLSWTYPSLFEKTPLMDETTRRGFKIRQAFQGRKP